jgi:hypothetical protein
MSALMKIAAVLAASLLGFGSALAQPAPFNYPAAGGGGSSSCSGDINAACSQVLGVGNVTTGVLPATHGGTGQGSAAAARGSAGLDIDELTGHGNSAYTILSTDRVVATNAAFTAAQTWTLPAANSLNPGQAVTVIDAQGTVTSTNTLTIARAGTDTINGGTSYVIAAAFDYATLVSDGVSKWTVAGCTAGCTFTGTTSWPNGTNIDANGNLTVGAATTASAILGHNGFGLVSGGGQIVQSDTSAGFLVSPQSMNQAAEARLWRQAPATLTLTGSYATNRFTEIDQNTVAAASALSLTTEAASVAIAGAPIAAGSATITKSIGLHIQSGSSLTAGATTGVALKVDAPTGAGANKAAEISGHAEYTGTAAALSSCGTSPSIVGNDMVGRVTVGTVPSTTCTLTFNTAFTNAPICFAQDETSGVTVRATTVSTTAVTFTASASMTAGDKLSYRCEGYF